MVETSYEMYPQRECFVCGKKWVIGHMGIIEGKYRACPEHYNEIINTYGINVTMDMINKDNELLKRCYNNFVTFINKVAKYEKYFDDKTYSSKVLTKHKELLSLLGKDMSRVSVVENDVIISKLNTWFTTTTAKKYLTPEELRDVKLDKSHYQDYYFKLVGRRTKERGVDKWLL